MQYLTYEEYKEIGGVLDEIAFIRSIDRTCGIIDSATRCRIEKMQAVPAQAKALCRDLVEYIYKNQLADKVISGKSQSAGGVSESESYAVKTKEDISADIDNLICDYLSDVKDDNGTPLLYRGCSV